MITKRSRFFVNYTLDKCPSTHPFAYSSGNRCCRIDKEGHSNVVTELCDGDQISITSSCCAADHIGCTNPPCGNYGK